MKINLIKIFTVISMCTAFHARAQESVNTAGGNASSSSGSVSYTIGQLANSNTTGSNGSVDEGVQQPFEIYTLGISAVPEISLSMGVYPNPASSFVVLSIDNFHAEALSYFLYDATGRLLETQKITDSKTNIQMAALPVATYMLLVKDPNKTVQTFKIIKKN
jgi:hypothetical protein